MAIRFREIRALTRPPAVNIEGINAFRRHEFQLKFNDGYYLSINPGYSGELTINLTRTPPVSRYGYNQSLVQLESSKNLADIYENGEISLTKDDFRVMSSTPIDLEQALDTLEVLLVLGSRSSIT